MTEAVRTAQIARWFNVAGSVLAAISSVIPHRLGEAKAHLHVPYRPRRCGRIHVVQA
jgi:hypothetical protein